MLLITEKDLRNNFETVDNVGFIGLYNHLALRFIKKHGIHYTYSIMGRIQHKLINQLHYADIDDLASSLATYANVYFVDQNSFLAKALQLYELKHKHGVKPLYSFTIGTKKGFIIFHLDGAYHDYTNTMFEHPEARYHRHLLNDIVKRPNDFVYWINKHVGIR